MKKSLTLFFTLYFTLCQITPVFSARQSNTVNDDQVQNLSNNIQARIYSIKKTKKYVAVELGFENPTAGYLEFTPTEIYLDEDDHYSHQPLSLADIQAIEARKPGVGIVPLVLGIGLGIAAIGTGISGNDDASDALTVAALSMGGAYVLTKSLENQVKQNKLITFENNSLSSIKRLPPGMTLGGFLYFPAAKHAKSITVIARTKSGQFEKKVFDLSQIKAPGKAKHKSRG